MTLKVPGTAVQLGGRERVLAPINAATFKQYRNELNTVFGGNSIPDIEFVATLVYHSLRRNYDDVTVEDALDWVDAGNYVDLLDIVVNVSGLAASLGKMMRRIAAASDPSTSTM